MSCDQSKFEFKVFEVDALGPVVTRLIRAQQRRQDIKKTYLMMDADMRGGSKDEEERELEIMIFGLMKY